MTRVIESVELFTLSAAHKTIDIDFHLPEVKGSSDHWYLPVAFLDKRPVAPDLEVFDHAGDVISVPTKRECMALTAEAISELDRAGAADCDGPEIKELIWQVISFGIPLEARVARAIAESRMPADNELLRLLLKRLEDRYLLWVPSIGNSASAHRISISRRQPQEREPALPRAIRRESEVVETAAGPAQVSFETPTGVRYPDLFTLTDRLMQAFGLVPLVHAQEVPDARRAASFHLRVQAPRGFVVRDIQLEIASGEERAADSITGQAVQDHPDITLQGHESELAHLHCAREENHSSLVMYTLFGLRDGLMTLWAGAVSFTAVLLWALHREAPYPVGGERIGSLELAGAILLVVPALASAWAIRADNGEVLEKFLVGARSLLLLSAALSVLAALSLVGIQPAGWKDRAAMEVYASLAYIAAIPIAVAWLASQRSTWFLYRQVLTTPARNLLLIAAAAAAGGLIALHDNPGDRWLGLVLLVEGLSVAVIGSNHAGLGSVRGRLYPYFAGFGVLLILTIAGYYLDIYASHFEAADVHLALLLSQAVLALGAGLAAYIRR